MGDDKKLTDILPNPAHVDERVIRATEEEINAVVVEVLRPYLRETIPVLMRKLNHQGVFDKTVRLHLEQYLKDTLEAYCDSVAADLTVKIDKRFRDTLLKEFDPRIEQAARKLLDERLAKLRAEFSK